MLSLGIDLGTSGVRATVIDVTGAALAESRRRLPENQQPNDWWQAVLAVLDELRDSTDLARVRSVAVDGTSATVLLCDADGQPCSPALMYHDQRCREQAETIRRIAPAESPARGAGSSLAKAMYLLAKYPDAVHIVHQADWISGRLGGRFGISDENNSLKLGYDPVTRQWSGWLGKIGIAPTLFPEVHPPGTIIGPVACYIADSLGLSRECQLVTGTTDSIAAFIATGADHVGDAVTSLGSTLVIKQIVAHPVYAAQQGIYSHRLGDAWLAGGASNAGGRALLEVFSKEELDELTPRLDPGQPTGLEYYPLPKPGERFPVYDPDKQPLMSPRPDDDARYLQGLLESLARIEAQGYAVLEQRGAGKLRRVITCGGGSVSEPWRAIRERVIGVPIVTAEHSEASYGSALLAMRGQYNGGKGRRASGKKK